MIIGKENSTRQKFTFKKQERLCSKKIIDKVFSEGKSLLIFPLKFVYIKTPLPTNYPAQCGFSVSKKNFKKAVLRNAIKRKLRESYRLNKTEFYKQLNTEQVAVFVIFIAKEIQDFNSVERAMKKGLKRIGKSVLVKNNRDEQRN